MQSELTLFLWHMPNDEFKKKNFKTFSKVLPNTALCCNHSFISVIVQQSIMTDENHKYMINPNYCIVYSLLTQKLNKISNKGGIFPVFNFFLKSVKYQKGLNVCNCPKQTPVCPSHIYTLFQKGLTSSPGGQTLPKSHSLVIFALAALKIRLIYMNIYFIIVYFYHTKCNFGAPNYLKLLSS